MHHALLFNQEQQVDKITSDIKGSIANKGAVRGIAHVVNVKDLNQFIKDSKAFQRGEILITTMTSPSWYLLSKKPPGLSPTKAELHHTPP